MNSLCVYRAPWEAGENYDTGCGNSVLQRAFCRCRFRPCPVKCRCTAVLSALHPARLLLCVCVWGVGRGGALVQL